MCEAAGLNRVRIHDLRHTFASLVASSGQSLLVIGELLGHSSPQTTKRYANLYEDSLRTAAEGVSIGLMLPKDGQAMPNKDKAITLRT